MFRWGVWDRLVGRRRIRPAGPPAPGVTPNCRLYSAASGAPRLTWIGHASFLGGLAGVSFLIDPVFSNRAGVVPRHVPAAMQAADLPPIEALLISHNHYDHLDRASVSALPRAVPVVVPLGLGRWFRRRGFSDVRELGWWDETEAGPLRVHLVPARHWSRRGIADTNRSLWGGFVVQAGRAAFYHAGDTAWFAGFDEIGRRWPGLLAAMLPVGSYDPAWFMEHHHLNPEQAVAAFLRTGARHMVPMHWGTFKLTDEPLREPAERVVEAWRDAAPGGGRTLRLLSVGETAVFDEPGDDA